jgi:hypothetical protein
MPFMLSNASAAGAGAPVATSGTGARAASGAKASYRLDGTESTLTPHVGHKVEITGTLDEQRPGSAAAGGAPNAPAGTLKVDSVKMVSTTCP